MKLVFKNVGQGDSIIVHWEEDLVNKMIVIDCNSFEGYIPTLDYINSFSNVSLAAVFLSHPHTDHYWGMRRMLEALAKKGIYTKYFFHTAQYDERYMENSVFSKPSRKELQKLFRLLINQRNEGHIKLAFVDGHSFGKIPFANNFMLSVLSPTSVEYGKYIAATNLPSSRKESSNNPDANWISTIITIEDERFIYLLTSDCNIYSLKRIDKEKFDRTKKLILGQSPHHGSKENHNNAFWKLRNWNGKGEIAISTGENNYGHPSPSVISFFNKMGYNVRITGQKIILTKEINDKLIALSSISGLDVKSPIDERDLVYDLAI